MILYTISVPEISYIVSYHFMLKFYYHMQQECYFGRDCLCTDCSVEPILVKRMYVYLNLRHFDVRCHLSLHSFRLCHEFLQNSFELSQKSINHMTADSYFLDHEKLPGSVARRDYISIAFVSGNSSIKTNGKSVPRYYRVGQYPLFRCARHGLSSDAISLIECLFRGRFTPLLSMAEISLFYNTKGRHLL